MTRGEEPSVVSCRKRGIAAHDGFAWSVDGTAFKRVRKLSRESRAFEDSIAQALEVMDRAERFVFIEEFFSALEATGAVTLDDLTEHRVRQAVTILSSLKNASNAKRFAALVLVQMLKELAPLPLDKNEAERLDEYVRKIHADLQELRESRGHILNRSSSD